MTAPKRPAHKRPAPKCSPPQTAAPKRRRPEVTYPCIMSYGTRNRTQLAKLIVATTCKLINVCWKVKFLVKDDPKGHGTDSVTEDKMMKGFSEQAPVNIRQSPTTTQPNKLSFSRVEKETVGSQTTRQGIQS